MSERSAERHPERHEPSTAGRVIGRTRPRASVLRCARVGLHSGAAVVITGDVGFGKTVLLDDLAPRLATDWIVARIQADREEAHLDLAAAETLCRVLSGLSPRRHPALTLPAGADAAEAGRTILAAVDTLPGPLCIIVDDAQWVDERSAGALRYIARRLVGQPFLLIAAARPTPNATPQLLSNAASLASHRETIVLEPFTARDTQTLAVDLLGYEISRRTATRLTHAANGSPLLVRALIEQLRDSIADASHPAVWDAPMPVSPPVAQAVAAALNGADPRTVATARLVAVLRDPVTVPALGTIAEQLSIETDLLAAAELGLVRVIDSGSVRRVEPSHALIADALEADVPGAERAAIHRTAARILVGRDALRHRVEAADREDLELSRELLAAARDAADRDEADLSIGFARSALLLCPAGELRDRCSLEVGLLAMRFRKHERLLDLIETFESLPPTLTRDAILVEFRIMRGDVAGSFGLAQGIVAAVRSGTGSVDPDSRATRSHIAGCIPMLQMATRDFGPVIEQVDIARTVLKDAPTSPDEVSDPALRWLVRPVDDLIWLLGWELTAASHLQRVDIIDRAAAELDVLAEVPHPSAALVDALVTRARAFILTGDLRRARADLERAGTFSFASQPSWTTSHGRTMLSHVLFLLGDWDRSLKVGDTAVATVLDETILTSWPVALAAAALVRAARGDEKRALDRLDAADRARPRLGSAYDGDLRFIARAELARAQGRRRDQLDAADAGRAAAEATSTMGWLSYRIDALAALGRSEEARTDFELCREPGSRWRPYYGALSWLEGRVFEAEGRLESACHAYQDACTRPDADLYPFPFAIALYDASRLHAVTGARSEARRCLERACGLFERLGAGTYLARGMQLLAELDGEGPSPQQGRGELRLDLLTARERDVARAVAAGMTNKEIAAQLFVSVTTVNFHVRNILGKLELSSRHDLRRMLTSHRGERARQ